MTDFGGPLYKFSSLAEAREEIATRDLGLTIRGLKLYPSPVPENYPTCDDGSPCPVAFVAADRQLYLMNFGARGVRPYHEKLQEAFPVQTG